MKRASQITHHYFREVLGELSIKEITLNKELIIQAERVTDLLSKINTNGSFICKTFTKK
ncbi:MAG: hypothetical protein K9K67_15595 [Bacteriovoracaceae bacterium]|nr:hypothetical protein [Bacteriovoracaceae bacterium]